MLVSEIPGAYDESPAMLLLQIWGHQTQPAYRFTVWVKHETDFQLTRGVVCWDNVPNVVVSTGYYTPGKSPWLHSVVQFVSEVISCKSLGQALSEDYSGRTLPANPFQCSGRWLWCDLLLSVPFNNLMSEPHFLKLTLVFSAVFLIA